VNLPVSFRKYNPQTDESFILNSWLKEFRLSPFAETISNPVYYANQHRIIENIIKRSDVVVCCNEEDEDQIYGYAVGEHTEQGELVLHWLYVKRPFRGFGLSELLTNKFERNGKKGYFTHLDNFMKFVAGKMGLIHDPYRAMQGEYYGDGRRSA
jgi:hypothetical protein